MESTVESNYIKLRNYTGENKAKDNSAASKESIESNTESKEQKHLISD